MNTSVHYMGLKLNSPFIAASSGLTAKVDRIEAFAQAGIGAVVLKSIFEEQINGEADFLTQQSQQFPESSDYIYHYVRQYSLENYLELIRAAKAAVSIPVIASINCFTSGAWESFAKEFEAAGADALELNIYSLPLSIEKSSLAIEDEYVHIVHTLSRSLKIPIAIKIGPHFTNLPAFIHRLKANGAKSVVLFNRFYAPDIDLERLVLTHAPVLSQEEEYLKVLRWVGIVSAQVEGLDISATTGIYTGESAVKQLLAGASTVQLCSALYNSERVDVIAQMIDRLKAFMKQHQFSSIDSFKGMLNYKKIEHPEMYERVQFMKYFGGKAVE